MFLPVQACKALSPTATDPFHEVVNLAGRLIFEVCLGNHRLAVNDDIFYQGDDFQDAVGLERIGAVKTEAPLCNAFNQAHFVTSKGFVELQIAFGKEYIPVFGFRKTIPLVLPAENLKIVEDIERICF